MEDPCKNCPTRKMYARSFDLHFWGDDCPYECKKHKIYKETLEDKTDERPGANVTVPFSWLVKFCTHIDFPEPLYDEQREVLWKKKLKEQFGTEV